MDFRHCAADGFLDGGRLDALARNHVGDDLGVDGRLKNAPLPCEKLVKLMGVGQVPVVRDGEGALHIAHHQRLRVFPHARAGSRVPHVPHGHLPFQPVQRLVAEHFGHKAHALGVGNHAAVVHGDAAAFLPAVLKGQQPVVRRIGGVGRAVGVNPEHAAFFAGVLRFH